MGHMVHQWRPNGDQEIVINRLVLLWLNAA
jgi:hypothetical protein